jgi:diaminopimelate epimerase
LKFSKYQALGNSYIVVEPIHPQGNLSPEIIKKICNKNYGVGSDGILVGPIKSELTNFGLRIFNPDASEAEKSGNGIRIFCRYLWDSGLVTSEKFLVKTTGGDVVAQVCDNGRNVQVEMGQVSFRSRDIPVMGPDREVLEEFIMIANNKICFSAATIGNPHCIVFTDCPTETMARDIGSLIEVHPIFPNRTNVQFVKVIDKHTIQVEIWERGAGYTLASGSSSCAAAAMAYKLGYCDATIAVHLAGGKIDIAIDKEFRVTMFGPVVAICSGMLSSDSLNG